jgi:hypothetical protein
LRVSRPDRVEPAVVVLLAFNSFKSGASGSSVITVTEPGHGRSTGDTVRFRDVDDFDGFTESTIENSSGYSITTVTDDTFTFTVSGETASTGNINGGGGISSAGPVTVSA